MVAQNCIKKIDKKKSTITNTVLENLSQNRDTFLIKRTKYISRVFLLNIFCAIKNFG